MTTNAPALDEIYKNLLTAFDPAAKRLVQAGRDLLKAWQAVAEATRAYADALNRLGVAGSNCDGETREIGRCLLQIAEAVKDLNKHERNTIGFYETQIIAPTEGNLDQDSKVIIEQRKTFEKKQKLMIERLKRDKKKGVPVEESMRMLRDYQGDCVKQALTEEKKRYTYMLDRHCALVSSQLQFHRKAISLYEHGIHKWKEACANPEELSAAALAALDAVIQPYATQSSLASSAISRTGVQSMLSEDIDTISNNEPSSIHSKEQSVGTFRSNESETVQATLHAATVILHDQQLNRNANGTKNGTDANRQMYQNAPADPPSTGSSTLSNGSRPAINDQHRLISAPSMSSLVTSPNGHASPNTHTTSNGSKAGLEYAVSSGPGKPLGIANAEMGAFSMGITGDLPRSNYPRVVAMFTYNNGGVNQLPFQEGDTILVVQDGQQGWQYGENVSTGKRGWYPASFAKPLEAVAHHQHRPRSHSTSTPAPVDAGTNGCNVNGMKQSASALTSDTRTSDVPTRKPNPRPVSVMVFHQEDESLSPVQKQAAQPVKLPSHAGSDHDVSVEEAGPTNTHTTNDGTVTKRNPFAHVKLRHVVKTDGTPKKYG